MYIILSGGFYGMSYKPEIWGFRPTPLGDGDRGVDFIINIKGIPSELIAPEGVGYHYKYFCNKCQAWVPEWDMERKQGCFFHDPQPERTEYKIWRIGTLEEYKNPRAKWIDPALRIWLDNQPGVEKWQAIKRYIEKRYPITKSLSEVTPRPVGTRREFTIAMDEVPEINVSNDKESLEEVKIGIQNGIDGKEAINKLLNKISELETKLQERTIEPKKKEDLRSKDAACDVCGKVCHGLLGLTQHRKIHFRKNNAEVKESETTPQGDVS